MVTLCAVCVLLGLREQERTSTFFLPLRGCQENGNQEYNQYHHGGPGAEFSFSSEDLPTTMATMATATAIATNLNNDISHDIQTDRRDEKESPSSSSSCHCYLPLNQEFKSQSGQDQYLFQRVFFPQGGLCCQGTFVEFGARNGITHSNTYVYEKNLGWKGLLFEVDAKEHEKLVQHRPNSDVVLGPVCPSYWDNVTIVLSNIPGYTGTSDTYGTYYFA